MTALQLKPKQQIISPSAALKLFRPLLVADVEEFWVAALGSEKNVLKLDCIFRGTVDHCLVHPRDIFRFAYVNNASSIVVAHNHPSGNPEPSTEDNEATKRLLRAGHILGIEVVDHLIIARSKAYYSYREAGVIGDERMWIGSF